MTTPIEMQAVILTDLWLNYRQDEEFADFVQYNDLGLPLAYAMAEGIIPANDTVKKFVEETFDILLGALEIEDEGFETLEEMLASGMDT
jgi:hypothetical protein